MSVNSNEEKAICSIGFPHAGFVLEVGIMDGTFHGSAVIQDTDELVYAMFERLRKQGCSGLNEEHYFLHHYHYNNFYRCYLY